MKQYLDSEIASLTDLLSFESVLSEPKPGMPFGENIFGALDYMLKLGASFGFETFNDEGFAGHIDFGYDKEVFAVLCHLDVVPAGKFWTMPPFKGTIKDNKIYGRGTLDNKGPAIAVLYAMKKLYDEGHIPKHKLRLILGCNEESGWQCMEHYNKSVGLPKTGFSPDSDFPVINAEKGVLQLEITLKNTSTKLTKFEGGNRVNMVADNCEFDFDGKTFSYSGKSAHGSKPEKGDNAIFKAFKELLTLTEDKTLKFINSNFVNNTDGKKTGLNIKDEISGNLTLNFGTIQLKEDKIICEIDIRYPVNSEKEIILNKFKTLLSEINAEIKVINYHKPLYVDENSDLIKNLLKAYKKVTNLETKCVSIGGATYARVLEKGVAFGPIFPEEISTIHEADEFISIENLLKITKIYYEALKQF